MRALVLCGLVAAPALLAAQAPDPGGALPEWAVRWSPLRSADLSRRLPGASAAVPLLYGTPRIGTFWTGGNPGALARDVRDGRADYYATVSRQSGTYRRPLDPESAHQAQGRVQAWRAVSPRFSLIGAVKLEQNGTDSARADFADPYGSSPFTLSDTLASPMRRIRAVLEGGAGWQLGGWGAGLTAGYATDEYQSTVSPVVRRTRLVQPAATAGLTRRTGSLLLGLFGTGRHTVESALLLGRTGTTLAQDLAGYRKVSGIPVNPTGTDARRREQRVLGAGGSIEGRLGSGRWVIAGIRSTTRERLTRQQRNDPDWDRWDQRAWDLRAAWQTPLGARRLLTVRAGYVAMGGEGALATDTTGFVFTARESGFFSSAELRLVPTPGSWEGSVALGLSRESRTRSDSITRIGTIVTSFTPSLAVELGRPLGERWAFALGGTVAHYGPTSTLPTPGSLNTTYRGYVVPEYAVYATRARVFALSALVRYRVSGRSELWISGRVEGLSPTDPAVAPYTRPVGSRSGLGLVAGVTVGR